MAARAVDWLVLSFFFLTSRVADASDEKKTLTFSLIVSYGLDGFNSSGSIPAVDLALEQIDKKGVLPGYRLRYTRVGDSGCNRGLSLDAFFDDFLSRSDQVNVALVGCGCSVATEPVAEISHRWNVSQISFASAVPTLSDRSRFRNYFRTSPSFDIVGPAILSVLEHYGWERIVFLTQNENLFRGLHSGFKTLVEGGVSTNVTLVNRLFETNAEPLPVIEDVLEDNGVYRVFFLNAYSAMARRIICEAANRRLTYPRYAWILFGWYPERWWAVEDPKNQITCSIQQLEDFLEEARALVIQVIPTPDDENAESDTGLTRREFLDIYKENTTARGFRENFAQGLAYDAIWTLALGLNRSREMIVTNDVRETNCTENAEGELVPLENFNYSNGLMGCVMRWSLEQTDFIGVSGHIKFDANGTIIHNKSKLLQYRRHIDNGTEVVERVRYGFVDSAMGFSLTYHNNENDESVFPSGIPPDGTPQKVIDTVHIGLVVVYDFLATVGIVFALGCIVFNFVFKNRKIIQLTSPNLNYFVIAGSLLMYISVFFQLLYTTDETAFYVRCILNTWLYTTGYLLAFGSILAKMWRVYHIFHSPTPNKMALRDWHLVIIVVGLTGVGLLLLIFHSASQPGSPLQVRNNENPEGRTPLGIREEHCILECYKAASPAFYCDLLIFFYLLLLQIVGIILAFQTRKVKIPILNDSKFVAALVYVSSIVLVVLVLVTFSPKGYINSKNSIFSAGILLLATIFLALMFVPKMFSLYQDPHGERIFDRSRPSHATSAAEPNRVQTSPFTPVRVEGEGVAALHQKIQDQEMMILERDGRISKLEQELGISKNGEVKT